MGRSAATSTTRKGAAAKRTARAGEGGELDAELARSPAAADVAMAAARGRVSAGGQARQGDDVVDEPDDEDVDDEPDEDDDGDQDDEPEPAPRNRTAKRAKAGKAADREGDPDGNDTQSWDEFWQAYNRRRAAEKGKAATTVIRGVEVVIPHDLPLAFDEHVAEVEGSDDDEDVEALVAELFGDDVFGEWKSAGMGTVEFQVVLLWGMAHGKGNPITFEQAVEGVETEGKSLAPNRSARRRSGKGGRS